jgi:predicted O-methyltransferase YrrM
VVEIGTFTGYSALTMTLALPDDGIVVSCDITDVLVAYDVWKEAGVDSKIRVELGPAVDSLNKMIVDGMSEKFDFALIVGDKNNYLNYYELCLKLVRPGGLIAFDNVLWVNLRFNL